jgi:tRNA(Ile)-lysidine synthetase-like protein
MARKEISSAYTLLDCDLLRIHVKENDLILAAVSGGPDSTALLVALAEVRREFGFKLACVYVDHCVRRGAGEKESAFVATLCKKLDVAFYFRRVKSLSDAPLLGSFEAKLRALRYECLRDVAKETGAAFVALGHTADDLVESFLMNLVRGAGVQSAFFKSLQRTEYGTFIRPLWRTWKDSVLSFLAEKGIHPLADETNLELHHTRNKIRHVLLPLLEKEFNPRAKETLFRTAQHLRMAAELVETKARRILRVAQKRASVLRSGLPVALIQHKSPIEQFAVLDLWLKRHLNKRVLSTAAAFDRIRNFLRKPGARIAPMGDDIVIVRVGDELLACKVSTTNSEQSSLLRDVSLILARQYQQERAKLLLADLYEPVRLVPDKNSMGGLWHGEVTDLAGKKRRVCLKIPPREGTTGEHPWFLRNRTPGDKITPSLSLKELLVSMKIPFIIRDYLLLVVDASDVPVAVCGFPQLTKQIARRRQLESAPLVWVEE